MTSLASRGSLTAWCTSCSSLFSPRRLSRLCRSSLTCRRREWSAGSLAKDSPNWKPTKSSIWVDAFREYEDRVEAKCDGLIGEALKLPEGSDARHAKALEIHAAYSAKVARQKDLVKRIRKLVKLRGEWPDEDPDEL